MNYKLDSKIETLLSSKFNNNKKEMKETQQLSGVGPLLTLKFPVTNSGLLFEEKILWDLTEKNIVSCEEFAASLRCDFSLPPVAEAIIVSQMKHQIQLWQRQQNISTHNSIKIKRKSLNTSSDDLNYFKKTKKLVNQNHAKVSFDRACHVCSEKPKKCFRYCRFFTHCICEEHLAEYCGIAVDEEQLESCPVCSMICSCLKCTKKKRRL